MTSLRSKTFALILALFGMAPALMALSVATTVPARAEVTVTADDANEPGLEEDQRVDDDTCEEVTDDNVRVSRC